MKKKHILLLIAIILISIIITLILLNFLSFIRKSPTIAFYKTSPEKNSLILEIIKNEETGLGEKVEIEVFDSNAALFTQFQNSKPDILISETPRLNSKWSELLSPINESLIDRYPTSTREMTKQDGLSLLLPLQLDHIELSYKKGTINQNNESNIIFSFNEMERQLSALAKDNHYPLMVSGSIGRDLLDFVSILVLSRTGVEGYRKLQDLFTMDLSFSELINSELNRGFSLKDVLEIIGTWEKQGIIHPEWMRFSREEAVSFMVDDLSSAYIMRLSTHRTLPDNLLTQLWESPFPFVERTDRAKGLIMPGYSLMVYKESRHMEKIRQLLPEIISNENQKKLTAFSGLAPMVSVAEALDRQSSNVRLWGAASQNMLAPLTDTNMETTKALREFLTGQ